jgi:hypothetical protein
MRGNFQEFLLKRFCSLSCRICPLIYLYFFLFIYIFKKKTKKKPPENFQSSKISFHFELFELSTSYSKLRTKN